MISQWVNIKESINFTFLNLKLRYHLQVNVKRNTNLFSITILQKHFIELCFCVHKLCTMIERLIIIIIMYINIYHVSLIKYLYFNYQLFGYLYRDYFSIKPNSSSRAYFSFENLGLAEMSYARNRISGGGSPRMRAMAPRRQTNQRQGGKQNGATVKLSQVIPVADK